MTRPSSLARPEVASGGERAGEAARLAVRGAVKSYGRTAALRGVGFELRPGEWVGLVGPNGAGKTTLMRALAGLVALDAGTIDVAGRRMGPHAAPALRSLIGLVPQEIALYPELTARENLGLFGRLHGVAGAELLERVEWALDWSALAEHAERQVATLSTGMRRRLNIAAGVLHAPRLVLLDEPTVGVDPQGRRRIWRMLDTLRHEGAALLQSSHQLDEIQNSCDRMLVLDHGSIVAAGSMAELNRELRLGRRVHAVIDRAPESPLRFPLGPLRQLELTGREISGWLCRPDTDLPLLVATIHGAGLQIDTLEVSAPRLEDIFMELTGRELRE